MNPLSVPKMIEISKQHPGAIVCASKFKKGAKRENYGYFHYVCNRTVNFLVERILNIRGTELISVFQIYPTEIYNRMKFRVYKRMFYEFTIRPLTRNIDYIEIPTDYKQREEGTSNFNLAKYIDLGVSFIRTAIHEKKLIKSQQKELNNNSKNS